MDRKIGRRTWNEVTDSIFTATVVGATTLFQKPSLGAEDVRATTLPYSHALKNRGRYVQHIV